MPFDGSGNFSRVHDWTDDRDAGIKIRADRMDEEFDDMASAFNVVFFRNGLVPMSGDIDMGSNSLTGIATGTAVSPSIQFASDPNTGAYLNGAGKVAFAANGVRRFEVDTAGAEVVGTFDVSGNTVLNSALAVYGDSNLAGNLIVSGNLTVSTNTNVANITASGTLNAANGFVGGARILTTADEGSGNGLDADTLDGQQGSYYLAASSYTAADVLAKLITVDGAGSGLDADSVDGIAGSDIVRVSTTQTITGAKTFQGTVTATSAFKVTNDFGNIQWWNSANTTRNAMLQHNGTDLNVITDVGDFKVDGNLVWHAGNDGAGSGLDADLLDGVQGGAYAKLSGAQTFDSVVTAQRFTNDGTSNDAIRAIGTSPFFSWWNSGASSRYGFMQHSGTTLTIRNEVSGGNIDFDTTGAGNVTVDANTVWHAGNDGAGSGLDADLLDGVQGSAYALAADYLPLAGGTMTGAIAFSGGRLAAAGSKLFIQGGTSSSDTNAEVAIARHTTGTTAIAKFQVYAITVEYPSTTTFTIGGNTVWHAGNDGAGSGLDADTVDGVQAANLVQTSGTQTITGTKNFTGTLQASGIEVGYRSIPRSTTTTTVASGDRGKCIAASGGLTVPSGTFAAGDAVSIYNNTASAITITQGSGLTLRSAGTADTGNRTLAARGMATVWFNSASEAIISGAGIS